MVCIVSTAVLRHPLPIEQRQERMSKRVCVVYEGLWERTLEEIMEEKGTQGADSIFLFLLSYLQSRPQLPMNSEFGLTYYFGPFF